MPIFSSKVKSFLQKIKTARGPHHLRRRLILCAGILTTLTIISLLCYLRPSAPSESEKFRTLARDIASYELQNNGVSLHYTLADCNAYDMTRYRLADSQTLLPLFSTEASVSEEAAYADFLDTLQDIDTSGLTAHEKLLYRILHDTLESSLENASYAYYYEPLSPSSGEQNSLLILLAAYRLESKEDIANYLELLAGIPSYFEGLLLYEQQKADAGLFMSDAAAEKLITQCDSLCTADSVLQQTHFLQTTFEARLRELLDANVLTEAEYDEYLAMNNELLLHTVSPAYTMLADGIFLLKGRGLNENGLCYYEDGSVYYENLLHSVTGSDRSPEEILNLLRDTFAADYLLLCDIAEKLLALETEGDVLSVELPFSTPEEMLADLQVRIQRDFPPLTDNIDCRIHAVDDALAPYVSPAFYLIPPIDDYTNNCIYINYADQPDDLTLYTTLAHEGYPGHLFQTVYHLADMDDESLLPLEGMLSCSGYAEGWATYVEDLSYEYVADILVEQCGYPAEYASLLTDFYRIDRRLQLCLYSMLDVSVHYYGMTKPEAASLLHAYGITDPESVTWIYEYVVEEPVCYLKYYLGYLEICELKKAAHAIWGDSYTEQKFHTFLLDAGPLPFGYLGEILKEPD